MSRARTAKGEQHDAGFEERHKHAFRLGPLDCSRSSYAFLWRK